MKTINSNLTYKILVLGLGNLLLGDDGIGVYAVEELQKKPWPPGVHLLEVGTSVFYYLEEISQAKHVIAIDAVYAGGLPGTVYRLDWRDMICCPETDAHAISLPGLIRQSRAIAGLPGSAVIYGVEPEDIDPGRPLTPAVKKSLPIVINHVAREIDRIIAACPHK